MSAHPYIAIEGAIGVGKSTLARILGEALSAEVLLEVFEENPFLSDFYADRARYAFQTQIFFLLSRYRQQHGVITATLNRNGLVSDYLFAKDWLFAHLNLGGDELAMYQRVHAILGEQIPTPSLVVYLKASTDTLMQRIASRDRPYERQMARDYIHALRLAYESFFSDYPTAPLLVIDTDDMDFVRNEHDRAKRSSARCAARYARPTISRVCWMRPPTMPSAGDGVGPEPARLPTPASRAGSRKRLPGRSLLQLHPSDRRNR